MVSLHVQKLHPGHELVCTVFYEGRIRTTTIRGGLSEGQEYGRWAIDRQEIRLRCRDGGIVAESKCTLTGQLCVVKPTPHPWHFEPATRR